MEIARFSEAAASTSHSTRRLNPEEHNHYRHSSESSNGARLIKFNTREEA
jgi:hypothetical protein